MLTTKYTRVEGWVKRVNGKKAPEHLLKLRIPPAWTDVEVDPDPKAVVIAIGFDAAGRKQRLYSAAHVAGAKSAKFERIRGLLAEREDIRTEIESSLNNPKVRGKEREAYLAAYLIYETGIRPGSTGSAYGNNSQEGTETFGATTLQLRHVKECAKGVRLKFIGKKGVAQNLLVTNPYLVEEFLRRKRATLAYKTWLFDVSSSKVNQVIKELGSEGYTAKDLRTALGTSIALDELEGRKRWPKTKKGRKQVINDAIDKVASKLGNTRAISRSAYVDPAVLDEFVPDHVKESIAPKPKKAS